jgi:DNA (cytosine-5)-methyltransferase 1
VIIGSLCTGYGGLEMGLRMVFPFARLAWVADNDKAASILLKARYPGVPNLGDITAIDWSTVERVDLLAAGIPCQPHSYAGKGRGKDDDRDLVEAFIEAVRELRPSFVLLENVPGFKRWGLPRVLGALAEMGFHARWHCVRASDAGACHQRERLFVLAFDPNGEPWKQWRQSASGQAEGWRAWANAGGSSGMGAEKCVTLPTPTARDGKGIDKKRTLLEAKVTLLPTPMASDASHGGAPGNGHQSGNDLRAKAIKLLPTPTAAIATGGQTSRSGDRKNEKLLTGIAKSIGASTKQPSDVKSESSGA